MVFKLWGEDTHGSLAVVEQPFDVGAWVSPHLHTREDEYSNRDRMIEIITPAGFEHLFREVADLVAAGPPAPQEGAALAERYGLRFAEAEWLPDVLARYGLAPASGS